ncbi:CRR6 family NdhI maturation factor [Phormidium tenue FACHB-886]|nr:CRR6 family NdhI maturation factor [Phormidium tenue FACHB-886]
MGTTLTLSGEAINALDLAPAEAILQPWIQENRIAAQERSLQFQIDYPREAGDPRELSEIPEVRLWFVRLDARYPWLPYVLDWEAELARYAAMLVPHQFAPDGIQYNPEALELFVMQKVFVLTDWMQQNNIGSRTKLKFITKMLGYELEEGFFELIGF